MTKKLFVFILAFSSLYCNAQQKTFHGIIQFPEQVQNPPAISLFYKGQEITVDIDLSGPAPKKGYYTIFEESACSELYMIVTQGLQLPELSETFALKTSSIHPYQLYKITRNSTESVSKAPLSQDTIKTDTNQPTAYWSIEPVTTKHKSVALPDNTLILLLHPSCITLEQETWSSEDAIIKLPRIVFNKELDEKSTQELGTKLALTALDYRALHKKLHHNTKLVQSRTLSVALPQKRFGI